MADPIQTLRNEWSVVKAAPWSVAAVAGMTFVFGLAIGGGLAKPLIEAAASHIERREPEVAEQVPGNRHALPPTQPTPTQTAEKAAARPARSPTENGPVASAPAATVTSTGQEGGVTAGAIGSVVQSPPR